MNLKSIHSLCLALAGLGIAEATMTTTTLTNSNNNEQGQTRLTGGVSGSLFSASLSNAALSNLPSNLGSGETTLNTLARSIIKFNYSDSLLSSIATVKSAKLRLYVTNNTLNATGIASSMPIFGAATMTQGNYMTTDFSSEAFSMPITNQVNNLTAINEWLEIDVTDLVARAFSDTNGSTITSGFRIQLNDDLNLTTGNPQPKISFTDNNNSPSTMPQLVITTVEAMPIQHLDATVASKVITNTTRKVERWEDLSGKGNHALAGVGQVTYPGNSLSHSGKIGLDFKTMSNSLVLFSQTAQDQWLDCTVNNEGFCVMLAFKCDALINNVTDLIGNSSTIGEGFSIRYESNGDLRVFLNGELEVSGTVAAGNTIVLALNYDASIGAWTFWNSKDGTTYQGIKSPGDFSRTDPVTLGRTTSPARYLNGMVGEVKIYQGSLNQAHFLKERQDFSEKWTVNRAATTGWRMISEDTTYPSNEVIVAYCEVTDSEYNLPSNTRTTDCTVAFQAAINAASGSGGGTVFVPAGEYRIDGTLNIHANVTLRGRWRELRASQPVMGTVLALYRTSGEPVISITGNGAGVRDLNFWHPEQSLITGEPVPYPFVIAGDSGQTTIENITLVNAYQGIDLSKSSMCCLRGIYGSPLKVGLTADQSYAVSRYINIHFSPNYWAWSGLAGSPPLAGPHKGYIRNNGTAINIKEMDGFHLLYSSFSGYWKSLLFQNGESGDNPWGFIAYVEIAQGTYGVHFESAKSIPVIHSSIEASQTAIWTNNHQATLTACTISSLGNAFVSEGNNDVLLTNCTRSGGVNMGTGLLKEQTLDPVPHFNQDYFKPRKPAKRNLYNVKHYGAAGDGVTDDTVAIQSAVAAAKANAGGLVMVPPGQYRMTDNLDLGVGVELRGSSGGRHISDADTQLGSVLLIEVGAGSATGTPFLKMGNQSGLRGMSFHYPHQTWEHSFVPYPFMVQGNGLNNYIIDCFSGNPYQAAELNGNDHLVEFTFFGGIRRTYRANNCSGGRIQYCHIKPDFWRDTCLPGNPKSDLERYKWNVTEEGLEVFYMKDCTNYSISSIFNHASKAFFTADNSSGQTLFIGGEQLQHGYTFSNGSKTFDMLGASCNINNIGDYSGTHGIKTLASFDGQARFFSAGVQGSSADSWAAEGGTLLLQGSSIDGPGNRGAMGIRCGIRGALSLLGSSSGQYLGFDNQGSVTMRNCSFSQGFVNSSLPPFLSDNSIQKTFILSDLNQGLARSYGLVAKTSELIIEDALNHPATIRPSESSDARRVKTARAKNGSFPFDVTDPEFTDGGKTNVTIDTQWYADTNCTIRVHYRTRTGAPVGQTVMKLGQTVSFTGATAPTWRNLSFTVNDAWFASTEDIKIEVINGDSPGLVYLAIISSRLPLARPAPPVNLVTTSMSGSIALDWKDNPESNLANYSVYRATTSGAHDSPMVTGLTTSSYVDNTVTNDSQYYYAVKAINSEGRASDFSAEVSATPMATVMDYQSWAAAFGGSSVIGNESNDYDGDSVSNLVEYALGTLPDQSTSFSLPSISITQAPAHLAFTFLRARADVTYVVEYSNNLSVWETLSHNPGEVGEQVTVMDSAPISPQGIKTRFLRLSVYIP